MRLGDVVIDIAPLRSVSRFRLVFAAQVISMLGTNLTVVAVNLQVYELTGSSLQVGTVAFVFGLSLMVGMLSGGVLADRADRRTIVVSARAIVVVVFAGLAVNSALPEPHLWAVYVAAVLAGGINGVGGPALLAVVPALVGPDRLAAAASLTVLFPELGTMHFGGGPETVGLLYSALAAGAFAGALVSGWAGRAARTGVVLAGAVIVYGAAIACLGLTASLWIALVALVCAGLADTISEILRRALVHRRTPDRLQGRIGGLFLAQAIVAPNAGNLTAGMLARVLPVQVVPLLGGVCCVAGVVLLIRRRPELRLASLTEQTAVAVKVADGV